MATSRVLEGIGFWGVLLAGGLALAGCGGRAASALLDAEAGSSALAEVGAERAGGAGSSGASPAVDAGNPCQGLCPPVLVGVLGFGDQLPSGDLSVDPARRRVYCGGIRVDVSDVHAMKTSSLPKAGRAVVDPGTGRYAATDESRTLFIFNADDTLFDSQPLPGAVSGMSADPATGLFYVTTVGENALLVYSQSARRVLATRPLDVAPSNPVFDASAGQIFVNWSPSDSMGYVYETLHIDRDYVSGRSTEGYVLATDSARHRIYIETSPSSRLEIRDSTSWAPVADQIDTDVYWVAPDPRLDRLYVRRLHDVAVFDRSSGTYLASLPLDPGFGIVGVDFVPGDDRLYVLGFSAGSAARSSELMLLVFATR